MYIFDIHSHVLPKLDDGAEDQAESLKMLKMSYAQGVRSIMATPHYSRRYHHYRTEELWGMCCSLEQKAKEQKIVDSGFHIYPGQELLYSEEMMEALRKGQVLTMGKSTCILVEFFPGISYSAICRGIREISMLSYQPIIAHVERYAALREADRMDELLDAGALMQMNYASIDGAWYERDTRWCRKMLKEKKIHFLGTDMHNATSRKPRIKEAMAWMKGHLDRGYVRDVCCRNAEKMLIDEKI